jgi:hypothetical protein
MFEILRGGLISIKGLAQMQCELLGPEAKDFAIWKKVHDWAHVSLDESRKVEESRVIPE